MPTVERIFPVLEHSEHKNTSFLLVHQSLYTCDIYYRSKMSELPFSTSNIDQEVKVRLGEEGQEAIPPKTVMQLFDVIVERLGDHQALFQKRPAPVRN